MEVRRQGDVLILRNHYGTRKRLGKYRSFAAIERALLQYCGDQRHIRPRQVVRSRDRRPPRPSLTPPASGAMMAYCAMS